MKDTILVTFDIKRNQ